MDYIVETRQQAWGDFEQKWAEASGTAVMPNQGPGTSTPPASKVIPKTGSVITLPNGETGRTGLNSKGGPELVGGLRRAGWRDAAIPKTAGEIIDPSNSLFTKSRQRLGIVPTPVGPKTGSVSAPEGVNMDGVAGEQHSKNPQAATVNPRVSVDGKEPPKIIQEKTAQHFAMPSIQRYPLDSYTEVKQASSYFETYRSQFAPAHRREFCEHLVKRAGVLGITVSDEVQKYGGEGYAPYAELEIAFGSRALLVDDDHRILLSKLAESRPSVDPETFAVALEEFDKLAGLDQLYDSELMDPYLSVFGKTAGDIDPDGSHIIGNDYVSNQQLKDLTGARHLELLTKTFGADFMKEFVKDPVGMFNSLPADQKKVIARCANEPAADEA